MEIIVENQIEQIESSLIKVLQSLFKEKSA